MNKKIIIATVVVLVSILVLIIFRGNLGIDFSDANLIYVSTTDNKSLTDNVIADASTLKNISRVEKIDNNKLMLYFQPLSDNADSRVAEFAAKYNLSQSATMIYRYAKDEYVFILDQSIGISLISLLVLFVYQGAELRGLGWKRWQVAYYITSDFFLTLLTVVVELGLASVLGELGMKMDNTFITVLFMAIAVSAIYRWYEADLIRRYKKDLSIIIKERKPELILLTCIVLIAGFLPLVVLSWQVMGWSILVLAAIGLNYAVSVYYKPGFVEFMFEEGKNTAFLKQKMLNKEW